MNLPKTILVPTDFGASSDRALAYAASLAKALGAEIVVLHAYDLPIIGFPDGALVATPELATRITEGANIGMRKALETHAGAGVPMRSVIKQGVTWRPYWTAGPLSARRLTAPAMASCRERVRKGDESALGP